MIRKLAAALTLLTFVAPSFASASVTLIDKDEWKVLMGGFVETDFFSDTRRSLTEVEGNTPIDRLGTPAGSNGRTQMSIRNSRLDFTILPPEVNEWKTKGYLEFDLLGYDPNASSSQPTNSEASFYTNATLRVRHAYMTAENNGWSLLAGQTWTLFGWQPTYVLTTASVPPAPGVLYQRTPQLTGMKTMMLSEQSKLQAGLSIARPSQRDSNMPNLDAGAKYAWAGRSSGFASSSGDVNVEPLSVALSATMRQFETPNDSTGANGVTKYNGTALAVDTMIPILAADDSKDPSNTLTLTGEYTTGKGDADAFPSWTGNLAQTPNGAPQTTVPSVTYMDPGQGAWDSNGNFSLIQLQSYNFQLQYHLPASCQSFVTAGWGRLSASSMGGLGPAASGKVLYDRSSIYFINIFHDFTKQLRAAVEYGNLGTHYVDGVSTSDDRYQVSAYFRF